MIVVVKPNTTKIYVSGARGKVGDPGPQGPPGPTGQSFKFETVELEANTTIDNGGAEFFDIGISAEQETFINAVLQTDVSSIEGFRVYTQIVANNTLRVLIQIVNGQDQTIIPNLIFKIIYL